MPEWRDGSGGSSDEVASYETSGDSSGHSRGSSMESRHAHPPSSGADGHGSDGSSARGSSPIGDLMAMQTTDFDDNDPNSLAASMASLGTAASDPFPAAMERPDSRDMANNADMDLTSSTNLENASGEPTHRPRVYVGPVSISVGSPQKVVEGPTSFVTYLVMSERPSQPAERVRRRFSDFVRLYGQLVAEYPGCAVPPLPDYSRFEYIAGDRFGPDFTNRRSASLQRFLFRLTRHPELGSSRALAAFLAPRDMSGARRSSMLSAQGVAGDGGVIDALSDSLLNAFTKVKYQSKEMLEARERADRFEHNVGTVDKAFLRMARRQSDIVHDLGDFYKQSLRLAKLEPSNQVEYEVLARTAKTLATNMADLHGNMDSTFAGALRDMTHYVQAVKALLRQREQRQIDYEALVEYLQRTEAEHAAAQTGTTNSTSSFLRTKVNDLRGVDKEQARQARMSKLTGRIEDLRLEVSKAKKVSTTFEEIAKREVAVFEATEALELKGSLGSIADGHIAFYKKVLEDCRAIDRDFKQGISGLVVPVANKPDSEAAPAEQEAQAAD